MLQASFEMGLQQGRLNNSSALPALVAPGGSVSFPTVALVCPGNELWQLSFGGVVLRTDVIPLPATVTCVAAFWIQNSQSRMLTVGPSNAASIATPVPTQTTPNLAAGEFYTSIFLAGIQAQAGDNIYGQLYVTNGSAGNVNVTFIDGAARFLPVRLVSELAVAGLQTARQDQLLDARLRSVRG